MSFRASFLGRVDDAPSRTEEPPSWPLGLLLLFAALVLQSAPPGLFAPGLLHVSLVALLLLWFGFRAGPLGGLLFGAVAGLGEDALGGTALAWTVAGAATGALAGALRGTLVAESVVYMGSAAAVLIFLRLQIAHFVRHLDAAATAAPAAGAGSDILQSAVGGLLAIVLLGFARTFRGDA